MQLGLYSELLSPATSYVLLVKSKLDLPRTFGCNRYSPGSTEVVPSAFQNLPSIVAQRGAVPSGRLSVCLLSSVRPMGGAIPLSHKCAILLA